MKEYYLTSFQSAYQLLKILKIQNQDEDWIREANHEIDNVWNT